MNYEEKIKRISQIVEKLENEEITLEENIKLVEEANSLTQKCKKYLEETTLKISKINENKEIDFE